MTKINFNPFVRTTSMKPLLSFAALAVTALALQSYRAEAQDSTSTSSSGSTSSSSSSSGSASGSRSGASTTSGTSGNQQRTNQRVNATTNIPITFNATDPAGAAGANGTNGGSVGGGGSNTPGGPTGQPYYGQSDVTIRTTPTVYAPPVSGGNPCTLAVSGGVSVIGWGAAAGGTFVDKDCADRQKIAMIHNAGYAKAAQELMCNDRATYMAFRGTQTPCNARPEFDGPASPQPIVRQQPVPVAPAPQQMVTKDRTNLPRCSRTITDNCYGG